MPDGTGATTVNKSARLCLHCKKDCTSEKLYRCSKCLSGRYCSKVCQRKHFGEHRIYCDAITALESIERQNRMKDFDCSFETPMNSKQRRKLIRLVGEKPIINFNLNGVPCQGLFDTGSMICLLNRDWFNEKFPGHELQPVSDFVGDDGGISLKAANNSEVSVEGVALMNFQLPGSDSGFDTPFLITSQPIENPVIGFNLIDFIGTGPGGGNPRELLGNALCG